MIMFDFQAIIDRSDLYNFHTHTQFCDGHAPMEDFVKQAISLGFVALGFTPHSPIPFTTSCNMSYGSVQDYFREIERLKEKCGDRIALYVAMEVDYLDDFGPSTPYFHKIPLDYRIGSVHFIRSFENPAQYIDIDGSVERFKQNMDTYFNGDIERVVREFFKQSMAMVDKGGFEVIGHFDKIGFNASSYRPGLDQEPWYDRLVRDLLTNIMDHHLVIEINTKQWEKHARFFPDQKYFALLKRYHAPVIVSSDAHYPALLNAGRDEALRLYRDINPCA